MCRHEYHNFKKTIEMLLTEASQALRTCLGVMDGQVPLALEISPNLGKNSDRLYPAGVLKATM
jgi:hypothetical protein